MRRLLCFLCPPLAVLLCGGAIVSALLNLALCMLFYIPGVIHAWGFVSDYKSKKQTDRLIKAQDRSMRRMTEALRDQR